MSTYTQILYQVVFGSKYYTSFLTKENQGILFAYIVGILQKRDCHPYQVGGYANHIHIVTHIAPSVALSDLVREIKKASHAMMAENKNLFARFPGWQVGYGAFTYNIALKTVLVNYVLNQESHHNSVPFKRELIQLLDDNLVEYNEDYLII